jgi:indole-3-glycerol phosphate synthase
MTTASMDTLEKILVGRKRQVQSAKEKVSLQVLEKAAKEMPPAKPFGSALNRSGRISVIAEMKSKSPSAGVIRSHYDVASIAKAYEKGGAAALSVLTEPDMFGGDSADITTARQASKLPILWKDFVFDPYQIVEARAAGADAVLLIVEMLAAAQLRELVACARANGLETLVEIFLESSLQAAVDSGSALLGINTRNLRTLEMVPDNVSRLAPKIPNDRTVVAESGLKSPADIEKLKSLPVAAVLVGESILKQTDLEAAVRKLVQAGS